MRKNLVWKTLLCVILTIVAVLMVYPPQRTLKPGIELAGGTSLIYAIDTYGLDQEQKKNLSEKMITVLRRRIDPAAIQNLIWRPQGNSRFEIQMPLSSVDAQQKRKEYEKTKEQLLAPNISLASVMRSLQKPQQQRDEDFKKFAQDSNERANILTELAKTSDELKQAQAKRDELATQLQTIENKLKENAIDTEKIKANAGKWIKLPEPNLDNAIKDMAGEKNIKAVKEYVDGYKQWANAVDALIEPETGKNDLYKKAKVQLDKLNLSEEQLDLVLSMSEKSPQRFESIEKLKAEFPERESLIIAAVSAYDKYRPFQGSLDDPRDLQRMLKGAGILEFRILPTTNRSDLDNEQINNYTQTLKAKGPKYSSDNKYIWCEIENDKEWKTTTAIKAQFGEKFYVLASNKDDEKLTHGGPGKDWKLTDSRPTQDQQGRRAIGFALDDVGGIKFGKLTGSNIGRPLCIILDGIAISAPNINDRITTSGIIQGMFDQTEVQDMVNKLNAGSLPSKLIEQPISVKTIGPSLGSDNLQKGIKSGIIGFVAVAVIMIGLYTVAGGIAEIALILNLLFTLAIMVFLRATFTMSGIAGFILTIGMGVDANILIYERIREEQEKGCSLGMAIKNGYEKAFSAIFDSNLTTFITAAILFWVASEDIKGFAIVLMLGLITNMFTALVVTRVIFDWLLAKGILKTHLTIFRVIRSVNIDWMGLRPVFLTLSGIIIIGGLLLFFFRDDSKNNKYDIEFTGGTSAVINFKEDMPIEEVRKRIKDVAENPGNPVPEMLNTTIYSIENSKRQYEITTMASNKSTTTITFKDANNTVESITAKLSDFEKLTVKKGNNPNSFVITTTQTNTSMLKEIIAKAFSNAEISEPVINEVVNNAIIASFGDKLQIQQNLKPQIISKDKITDKVAESYPELANFMGGLKIVCKLEKSVPFAEIESRFKDLRFKPELRNLEWYTYEILDPNLEKIDPNRVVSTFAYISVQPEAGLRQFSDEEWQQFTNAEETKIIAAAQLETSLPRVTQIDPSVGDEAKTSALIAIILSLIATVVYVWFRFGNVRYGLGAILSLVHDVCAMLGIFMACAFISQTTIGKALLIGDFKINLTIIAAFLTLIGYSLNDTIVVFDRIRENRKKAQMKAQTINDSINQTLSRTLMTGCTTVMVIFIMYLFAGEALRGFNFVMGVGIIIGTYSSIAIASPLLLIGLRDKKES